MKVEHVECARARMQIPELGSERPCAVLTTHCTVHAVSSINTRSIPFKVVYYYAFVSKPNRWASSPHRLHINELE